MKNQLNHVEQDYRELPGEAFEEAMNFSNRIRDFLHRIIWWRLATVVAIFVSIAVALVKVWKMVNG